MQIPKPLIEARRARSSAKRAVRPALGLAIAAFASQVHASMFSGEALDKVADIMAVVVLILVPVVVIVVFWLVHVLPEVFAEKRHHPQAQAIQVLCLLSLVFGGLLWPIAWLWAFTRPVGYKLAYGTDKDAGYHEAMGEQAKAGKLLPQELEHLRGELDSMAAKGALPPALKRLRDDLATIEAPPAGAAPAEGGRA